MMRERSAMLAALMAALLVVGALTGAQAQAPFKVGNDLGHVCSAPDMCNSGCGAGSQP